MTIWSIVRRKVVNGCNSPASILGQSWKSTRVAASSHPRHYGALAKETSLVVRGSRMVNSVFLLIEVPI